MDVDVISNARRIATRNLAKRGAASLTDADRLHVETEIEIAICQTMYSFCYISIVHSTFPRNEFNENSKRLDRRSSDEVPCGAPSLGIHATQRSRHHSFFYSSFHGFSLTTMELYIPLDSAYQCCGILFPYPFVLFSIALPAKGMHFRLPRVWLYVNTPIYAIPTK